MANVPGVDTALLAKVNLNVEAAWTPNQAKIENEQVDAETLKIMYAKQKPLGDTFIEKIVDPEKDHDVKVHWPDFCGLEAVDGVTDVCNDLDANMAPVIEKQYKIESSIEDKYAIEEDKLAASSIDKAVFIAQNQNAVIKRLLEKWSLKHIAFLSANAGYNAGKLFNFAGGVTEVPSTEYANMALMNKLVQDMLYSKIPGAFLVDGGPMHLSYTTAKQNMSNAEGKGEGARASLFDANFDLLGFAKAGIADKSFLVAPYSYASVTKNYVKVWVPTYDEALGTKGMWKYTINIPMFNLKIDVFHQRVCIDGVKQRYKLIWLFKLHYGIFLNPTGCDLGGGNKVSGIIAYQQKPVL